MNEEIYEMLSIINKNTDMLMDIIQKLQARVDKLEEKSDMKKEKCGCRCHKQGAAFCERCEFYHGEWKSGVERDS